MEVYIPWNNTWLDLPLLPDLGEGDGRMDRTRILYTTDSAGGFYLSLLGGSSTRWNTAEYTSVNNVWTLLWDKGSKTYSWTDRDAPALGR